MEYLPDLPPDAYHEPLDDRLARMADHLAAKPVPATPERESRPKPQPVDLEAMSGNALRPTTFDQLIGQEKVKHVLRRMVQASAIRGVPLDHILLVGPSGTGKTTLAHVIAHELGKRVYQLEAPISADTLRDLSEVMEEGDILFIDEIHQQAIAERRGKSASTQPEVLFSVMEDFTLPTADGVLPFPRITIMGATTDEGALPDAFVNRFPIRPRLERYTVEDMERIALLNADALGILLDRRAAQMFAKACRGVPREMNNYMRNAAMLTDSVVKPELASEVLHDFNGVTEDGLTQDMQAMIRFLYLSCRRESPTQGTRYQASVGSIATAIGKSRDVKAIQLRVEPHLIERGFIQVAHGGRVLTHQGILRARELVKETA